MITQDRLKELYTYYAQTGLFVRNASRQGVLKGSVGGTTSQHFGYVHINIDGKTYKAHRLAYLYMLGKWPEYEVDHIDGDRANNSWVNLRDSTRSENSRNLSRRSDNTSGQVGVGFHAKRNQWRARILGHHIGWFSTKEQAVEARLAHELNKTFSERHGKEFSEFNNSYWSQDSGQFKQV